MSEVIVMCDSNWDCGAADECRASTLPVQCPRWRKIGPSLEVPDKSWREKYEELEWKDRTIWHTTPVVEQPPRPGAYWVKGHWRGGVTQEDITTNSVTKPGWWQCGRCQVVNPPEIGACPCQAITATDEPDSLGAAL
jgi:hypothetical protein